MVKDGIITSVPIRNSHEFRDEKQRTCFDKGSWYTGNTLPWHGRVAGPIPAESTLRPSGYEVALPQVSLKSVPSEAKQSGTSLMHYCYILYLANGKYYVGYSSDLKVRISEHKSGKVHATKHNLPVRLVYYAAFVSKNKALEFERYLKTNSGFAFRNKRLT